VTVVTTQAVQLALGFIADARLEQLRPNAADVQSAAADKADLAKVRGQLLQAESKVQSSTVQQTDGVVDAVKFVCTRKKMSEDS
jgi:hypothetical protein